MHALELPVQRSRVAVGPAGAPLPPSSYLIGPTVEARDLSGALQEAAAALGQVLAHPAVEGGDAAAQTGAGVAQSL